MREQFFNDAGLMVTWHSWHSVAGECSGTLGSNVTPDIVCLDSLTVTTQRTFKLTEYSMLYWKSSSYVIHDVIGESIVHYSNISHINIADRQHITGRPACPISDYHMAGRTGLFSELVLVLKWIIKQSLVGQVSTVRLLNISLMMTTSSVTRSDPISVWGVRCEM